MSIKKKNKKDTKINKIKYMWQNYTPTIDSNNNRLITYFDEERWETYKLAIKRYPKSKEKGIILKRDYDDPGANYRNRPSLWMSNNLHDLSDFWIIQEVITEKDIEKDKRESKLKRILCYR